MDEVKQLERELKTLFSPQYASTTQPDPNQFKRWNGLTQEEKTRFGEISMELNLLDWTPEKSMDTLVATATKESLMDWWKDLTQGADIEIGFVPVLETLYDVFCAVFEYSPTGELTPLERALAISCAIAPIK